MGVGVKKMDDADSVTKLLEQEDAQRQETLRSNRIKAKPLRKTCKECGIKLNRIRREYGLCVDCAIDQEKISTRSI